MEPLFLLTMDTLEVKKNTLNSETTYGGGVCIGLQSTFSILPNTTVDWEKNCARLGGVIYAIDASHCAALIQKKSASFKSMPRICPILMANLFARTTLLILQEVCYVVVQ